MESLTQGLKMVEEKFDTIIFMKDLDTAFWLSYSDSALHFHTFPICCSFVFWDSCSVSSIIGFQSYGLWHIKTYWWLNLCYFMRQYRNEFLPFEDIIRTVSWDHYCNTISLLLAYFFCAPLLACIEYNSITIIGLKISQNLIR